MARIAIVGGGLSGLAAAAALGSSDHNVDLFESRAFVGGRATSYAAPPTEDRPSETIDNCQHILLRCCVNLLDFYERLQVANDIEFHREFYFLEPGGRMSRFRAGRLPTPLHFTGSFASLTYLSWREKLALARAVLALRRERLTRTDLEQITMQQWLEEKRQPPRVIERFWRQVLVSAINEELDQMAAAHGFQVFWLGFLARADAYEMGVPSVPLGELYRSTAWARWPNVRLHLRTPVERICIENGRAVGVRAGGEAHPANAVVCSLPFERITAVVPELQLPVHEFSHSPITGIHLWFDRPVTNLPHGTLLDSPLHWFFAKSDGKYLQLVVSASREMLAMSRGDIIDLALRELARFLPAVPNAKLEKAHVVKEVRATFSAKPGLEAARPGAVTSIERLFLAGDWTKSGWPATMEGAVRSGYMAAEAVSASLGEPRRYCLPDIA